MRELPSNVLEVDGSIEQTDGYRLLFEAHPHPMWVYDIDTLRFLAVNAAACRHFGYQAPEFLALSLADIRPPEDVPALLEDVIGLRDASFHAASGWRHCLKDGTIIDVEIASSALWFAGRPARLVSVTDVTSRKDMERELRRAEAKYQDIFENAVEGIFQTTFEGRYLTANPALARIYGFDSPEELKESMSDIASELYVDPNRRAEFARLMHRHDEVTGFESQVRRRDKSVIWITESSRAVRDAQGHLLYYEGIVEEITERKQAEEQLAYQATHDALTGLPNRALLLRRMDEAVNSTRPRDAAFALLLLDLDRFKEINDTFGHHYGDEVLRQLSPILTGVVRDSDTVARLGGDEFGILLPGSDCERAKAVAARILAGLSRPVMVCEQPLDVGVSIGIALFPEHGSEGTTILQKADVAMYAAKRARAGLALFSAEQSSYTPRRLAMVGELRQGIENNQLLMHYQPKVDLKTRRVVGAEALVRWQHPRDGLVPPVEFIPIAEHTGLIRPLGLWTLNTALLQCRVWHQKGLELNVAVNLAPDNLQDEALFDTIVKLLGGSDALPHWLTVEVTESAVMDDPARAKTVLTRLHELGVRIAIDDFGTGYSSLAYLKELPVDEVKVDRSFVREMAVNERDACIVRAVIDLGHNLGLRVVAEGVEDRETVDLLTSLGCDLVQGFYYSPPLPPADFISWVTTPHDDLAP